MKICPKCGVQLSDDVAKCPYCDTDIRKKSARKLVIISLVVAVYACVSVVAILALTNVICIRHSWEPATCTQAKYCRNCGEVSGEIPDHDWADANCTSPKTCKLCNLTEGTALGHTKGRWVIAENPTLCLQGKETLPCQNCGMVMESRVLDKKVPRVEGKSFNFTEPELLDWLATVLMIDIDLGEVIENDSGGTYPITSKTGEVGAMNLGHSNTPGIKNVCGLMIYFNNPSTAISLIAQIGEQIEPGFSRADASMKLITNTPYTKGAVTALMHEVDGLYTAVLLPTEYYTSDWFKVQ